MADDEEGEAEFFSEFEEMFFGNMFGKGTSFFEGGGEFDEFSDFLASDTKFMRGMFRDLGKNSRIPRGGKRSRKADGAGMEDMLNFFMMGGMSMSKKPNKKKSKKKEADGWETEEEEIDGEEDQQHKAK